MKEINGKTKTLGLFGYPVNHTLSPAIFNTISRIMGLNYAYLPFQVQPEALAKALEGAKALGIEGINVTIPHKTAVIPYLNQIDPFAKACQSVNTIKFSPHGTKGYSTDGYGFIESLRDGLEDNPEKDINNLKNKDVVVLGAGGAAKAISLALLQENIGSLTIINRTAANGQALVESLVKVMPEAKDKVKTADKPNKCNLLVNTTPLGMHDKLSPMSQNDFQPLLEDCLVYDCIYNPRDTPFLQMARKLGFKTQNGFLMLIYQALKAYELLTEEKPSKEAVMAVKRRLSMDKNIILTGFMGAGKTTVGQKLAQMLSTAFIDLDQEIEKTEGVSINAIFEQKGQAYFREIEHKILIEATQQKGAVIALGGGCLTDPRNIQHCRENGYLIWLKASLEVILERLKEDKSRPLFKNKTNQQLEALLKEREEGYKNCHFQTDSTSNVENDILEFIEYGCFAQ